MHIINNVSSTIPVHLLSGDRSAASIAGLPMPKRKQCSSQRVFVFPAQGEHRGVDADQQPSTVYQGIADLRTGTVVPTTLTPHKPLRAAYDVVLSGSYRKDFSALKKTYEELLDLGCSVLSPTSVNAVCRVAGRRGRCYA